MLSIVIPTHNEIKNNYLDNILELLLSLSFVEIICVDHQSTDGTVKLIQKYPKVKLIHANAPSRGERLNIGAQASSSSMIILHHPRSLLQKEGLVYLNDHQDSLKLRES